ncbi:MAG: hypothetical protein GY812_12605 [Actinomycetia bacterium]|nr:hypothetical protein [Actinomycetes bacterium]
MAPRSLHSMAPRGSTARRLIALPLVWLVLVSLASVGLGGPVGAQEPDQPGEDTTTTLAELDTAGTPAREAPLTESEKASRTINLVVIALLTLAAVVFVATIVFWRRTRPARLMASEATEVADAAPSSPPPDPTPFAQAPSPMPSQAPAQSPAQPPAAARSVPAAPSARPPALAPTAPGSWSAVAASVGIDQQVRATPRPAFETDSGGTWASQGWGERTPDASVLPQGFSGTEPAETSPNDAADEGPGAPNPFE